MSPEPFMPPCPVDGTPMNWAYSSADHHKYKCEKCGRIREFPVPPPHRELQDLSQTYEFFGRAKLGVAEPPRKGAI